MKAFFSIVAGLVLVALIFWVVFGQRIVANRFISRLAPQQQAYYPAWRKQPVKLPPGTLSPPCPCVTMS